MKETALRRLFTHLTNLARLLTIYPVAAFCFHGVLKRTQTAIWPYALLFLVLGFCVGLLNRFLRQKFKKLLWLRLSQAGCILLGIAVGLLGCRFLGGTGLEYLFSGLLGGVWAFLGCLLSLVPLQRFEFFLCALAYLAAVVVLSWRGFGYPITSYLIQFLLISAVFALELNFQNIDNLMQRRGHQMSHLPRRIRLFNLAAVLLAVGVLVLLVLFRRPLMQGTGMVLGAVWGVIRFLLTPLRRWWNGLDDAGDPNFGQIDPDWEGDPQDAFQQLVGPEDEGPAWDAQTQIDVMIVIVSVLVVGLLIYFRRPIWEALRSFFRLLGDAISSLFHRLGAVRQFGLDESEYFTDEEVRLDESERLGYSEQRAWKRDLKAYGKMAESREKYLAGWALTVQGLRLHGASIKLSDTPLEILDKAGKVLDRDGYAVATQSALVLAFSDHNEPPAWPELRAALERLRTQKK